MHTLPERIYDSLAIGGTVTLIDGDEATTVPWTEIHEDAKAMAADLQARGVAPGSHVALLGPTSRRLITGIEAVWLAGGTVVVMPLPMRMGSIDEFIDQTRRRLASADVSLLLIDHQLAPFIEPVPSDPPMVVLDQVVGDPTSFQAPKVSPVVAGDPAVHERLDVGPEGRRRSRTARCAPTSTRWPRPSTSTHGSTCWCRGCRCTTTWASSGCSRSR